MDDVPITPEWWPNLLWQLHFGKKPFPGPGPINYPPVIEDIMASLTMHTMSYLWLDQQAAQQLRNHVEQQLVNSVKSLSRLHDEAVAHEANSEQMS